jgi:hypothetical protein
MRGGAFLALLCLMHTRTPQHRWGRLWGWGNRHSLEFLAESFHRVSSPMARQTGLISNWWQKCINDILSLLDLEVVGGELGRAAGVGGKGEGRVSEDYICALEGGDEG